MTRLAVTLPGLRILRPNGVSVTAIRSVRAAEGKFVQIANAAMQDRRLSFTARGVLAFVLSLPPEQHLTAAWLEAQGPDGRRAVRSALRELERCGYYCRTRTSVGGTWVWEQVISDAPLTLEPGQADDATSEDAASSQVNASGRFAPDASASAANPSHKELNTEPPKDVDQKMVQGRASRRAHASGERATRTVSQVVREIREAVAEVHGQQEADDLSDDEALGLYFTYVGTDGRQVREVAAYMAKILADAPYLDTLLANSEAVCATCVQWESNCHCPAAA